MKTPHIPILLEAVLDFFAGRRLLYCADLTVGAGGHAEALLRAHPEIELFIGIDRDPEALALAKERLSPWRDKLELIQGDFRDLDTLLPSGEVDGIFLDLGVSSMQLDRPEKGFSLYKEGPLDMRMDPEEPLTAERIINTFSQRELETLFREYGEEPHWKRAAKGIVEARRKKPIRTTTELTRVLERVLTWRGRRGKRIHPATLIFQALRIRVNDELGALAEGLPKAVARLSRGGRLGVLAFHSLEDRIVKTTFREAAKEGVVTLLTKKPRVANLAEVRQNPRSRSARLRFVEKS